MNTWKKTLIIALCVIAATMVVVIGIVSNNWYRRTHTHSYIEKVRVNDRIRIEHIWKAGYGYSCLVDNRTDKRITPLWRHIYQNTFDIADSIVVYRTQEGKRGYVNISSGEIVTPAIYDHAWNFSEGLAAVHLNGSISFITSDGKPAFDRSFPVSYDGDCAYMYHYGLCVMQTPENHWGMIDTHGEWVIEPIYNSIDSPTFGYRKFLKGTKYGLLTMDGQIALPAEYDIIRIASDKSGFILAKDGYAKQVDKQLKTTIPFVLDGLHILYYVDDYCSNGYMNDDKQNTVAPRYWRYDVGYGSGVIDKDGRVIIPAKYYMVRIVNENLFEVEVTYGGDRILFNAKGEIVSSKNV